MSLSIESDFKTIGRIPFLKQLLKKMSAKLVEIIHLIPKSNKDQGACSLLEPHPKLSPAINENGGNSKIISYEGGHHSFDAIDPVMYIPNAIAVGRRHTYVGKDGSHYHEDKEGNKTFMNEPHERAKLFKDRAKIGAHLGGNWEARRSSMKDSVNFLLDNITN